MMVAAIEINKKKGEEGIHLQSLALSFQRFSTFPPLRGGI